MKPWHLHILALAILALMALLAHFFGAIVPLPPPAGVLTVDKIRVKDVRVHVNPLSVAMGMNNGLCSIGLAAPGVHIDWQVDLERSGSAHPADWGKLTMVQNVNFHHRRILTAPPPPKQCVGSANFALDGQYPYLNLVTPCAAGTNRISLADEPNVAAESPSQPFEGVEVLPVDQFRSYLIWEITDDNQPPSPTNPARQHVIGRVDWHWRGVAAGLSGKGCVSAQFSPQGWDAQNTDANVDRTLIGAAATQPTPPSTSGDPVFQPIAAPQAWAPCP